MRFAGMAFFALAIVALACRSTGESAETAAHPEDKAVATGESQDAAVGKHSPDGAAEELQEQYEEREQRYSEDPEREQDAEERRLNGPKQLVAADRGR